MTWPATDLPPGADRGHDFYCHWLPDGHDGPCEPFPTAARLATEWHRAYTTAKPRTRPAEVLA